MAKITNIEKKFTVIFHFHVQLNYKYQHSSKNTAMYIWLGNATDGFKKNHSTWPTNKETWSPWISQPLSFGSLRDCIESCCSLPSPTQYLIGGKKTKTNKTKLHWNYRRQHNSVCKIFSERQEICGSNSSQCKRKIKVKMLLIGNVSVKETV